MHNHVNSNFKHMFVFVGQAYFPFLLHNDMQAREDEGGGCEVAGRAQLLARPSDAKLRPVRNSRTRSHPLIGKLPPDLL